MSKSSFIFTFIGPDNRGGGAIQVRVEEALDGIVMIDYGIYDLFQGQATILCFKEDFLTGKNRFTIDESIGSGARITTEGLQFIMGKALGVESDIEL